MGTVYLIHFERPLEHARHYMGYCEDGHLMDRVQRHLDGNGSKLLAAVVAAGIHFEVVRTWDGPSIDRHFERKLKNRKNTPRLCPVCSGEEKRNSPLTEPTEAPNLAVEVG